MRKAIYSVAAISLATVLAGCGQANQESDSSGSSDDDLVVGVSNLGLSFPFPASIGEGIKAKGEELGVEVVQLDAKGAAETQANTVTELIAKDPDGILLLPVDSKVATGLVDQITAEDIPVVAVASQVGDPETRDIEDVYDGLVGLATQQETEAGRVAGELALDALPEGGKMAVVEGAAGFAEVQTRFAKFLEPAKEAGVEFDVVARQPGDWVASKSESACQNMLSSDPDIDLFYAQSDDMAAGCAKAISSANSDAVVIGIGGAQLGIDAVKSGAVYGTVCYKPEDLGELAMQTLYDHITGESEETEQFVSYDTPAITKDNIADCKPQW